MSDKKQIYKPRPVSGFPEWLPEVRLVEQQWLDHIRRVFESYGYASIETPAVEELNVIQAKGGDGGADVDKEVYVIERLHKEDGDKEARLALHFDQTVPLARYVAQHFNDLTFPFKRYQMQKVWRGERPQAGRFREFYQCDIDVINPDNLPLHFDAEMPAIIWEILSSLPKTKNDQIQLRISNRKILTGYVESLGIHSEGMKAIIFRTIDRLSKEEISPLITGMKEALIQHGEQPNLDVDQITESVMKFIKIAKNKFSNSTQLENVLINSAEINTSNPLLQKGIEELGFVLDQLEHLPEGAAVGDLSIIRGLDYYTGTVYETVFKDDPIDELAYGSICSGGRYDDLAGNYINKHLPGVGISIGFSRLFDRYRRQGKLQLGPKAPTEVLVILIDENERPAAAAKAKELRDMGFNVELYHAAAKIKKQFEYAEKKGIPFVLTPKDGAPGIWEAKNMETREQKSEEDWLNSICTEENCAS